ncbi:MAG TPA: hypothetical protein VJX23_01270 [Candidatus Binataceae bacterium]|nr:hypothetical protein [Candidatus Binataceae bacterium]
MKRLITTGALAIGLMVIAAGCTAQESRKAASEWIGKDRTQLATQMGQPKEAVPMTDTGGEMLFYSYEGHHYVFETGPDGLITSAVQTR